MKAIRFLTISKYGKQSLLTQEDFSKHLRWLRKQGIRPFPQVLVEGLPGEEKPKWINYEQYKKLKKEEQKVC